MAESVRFVGPIILSGKVVEGFKRGSKQLGFPTANLDPNAFKNKIDIEPGVYFGWAKVNNSNIFRTMLSIGWNPFFKNTEKTVEAWIDYTFDKDFYGENLTLCICGYIRPEKNFNSLEDLISEINNDIKIGREHLEIEPYKNTKFKITSSL